MRTWRSARRALLLALACVLLLGRISAAASPALSADFDGDGHHDRVTLDHAEPLVLRVWLSATNATTIIRTQAPVSRLLATDLDGDHRSELIAGGHTGLQVWTKKRHGFRSFRQSHDTGTDLARGGRRAVDEGPTDTPCAVPGPGLAPFTAPLQFHPGAPAATSSTPTPQLTAMRRSESASAPFVPRPPPAHI